MSTTFAPTYAETDTIGWVVACNCGTVTGDVFTKYADARTAMMDSAPISCGDEMCDAYGNTVNAVPAHPDMPELNVSMLNFAHIADLLGITDLTDGGVGSLDAQDFLGRVLLAVGMAPADEGVPAHDVPGPGAQFVNCGRRPGYTEDVLDRLRGVAEWAIAHGRTITWA